MSSPSPSPSPAPAPAPIVGGRDDEDELRFAPFFGPLVEAEDAEGRAEAVRRIEEALLAAAGARDPGPASSLTPAELHAAERLGKRMVEAHLGAVHALAHECPFADVREGMARLAQSLARRGWSPPPHASAEGPSRFVPEAELVPPSPGDEQVRHLFEDVFASSGRLTHLDRVLGWHPTFLRAFTRTMSFVMREDGPLPATWRHYLAIMASSRYACAYLVDVQGKEFLMSDGDPAWLAGLSRAPRKLQNLARVNALLAHQPWLLTASHVEVLVDTSSQAQGDAWSHSELVQAVVILTTFHALCGLVAGLGIRPERDFSLESWEADGAAADERGREVVAGEEEEEEENGGRGGGDNNKEDEEVIPVPARSDKAATAAAPQNAPAPPRPLMERLTLTEDQRQELVAALPLQGAFESAAAACEVGEEKGVCAAWEEEEERLSALARRVSARFLSARGGEETGVGRLRYENFDVHSTAYNVFRSHDYNWKEHGYVLVDKFYPGVAPLLDAEMDLIYGLTYQSFNEHQNIDTAPFRQAVFYYAHRLYGVSYDDYSYRQVNVFVDIEVKSFVRKIACHPSTTTAADFDGCGSFLPAEKCHIALLAVEGRRQSSLLYGLRALLQARQGS